MWLEIGVKRRRCNEVEEAGQLWQTGCAGSNLARMRKASAQRVAHGGEHALAGFRRDGLAGFFVGVLDQFWGKLL